MGLLTYLHFRYSLNNDQNQWCLWQSLFQGAYCVLQSLQCGIMDQDVFTHCEIQSASYDCQFRSLNSYNYYQKEELCLHELLPFFLPSVCPSVLRQLRHNGAFVIAGRSVNGHH